MSGNYYEVVNESSQTGLCTTVNNKNKLSAEKLKDTFYLALVFTLACCLSCVMNFSFGMKSIL